MNDVMSLNQDNDITELKSKYMQLSKMYDDTQRNSKMLEDELESTKTKLKASESQLMRSPKWSPSQKHESEIQFIKARHQAELDSLNTKLYEKEQEIDELKRKCCTNNPDITSFITFATKSIQFSIERGTSNDQKELISQYEATLHDFQSFLTQASSLQRFFQTMKSLIKVLVDTNVSLSSQKQEREASHVFSLEKCVTSFENDLNSKNQEISQIKESNSRLSYTVSELRDQLTVACTERDSFKNQCNLQTTSINELVQKLNSISPSSPSKFKLSSDFFDSYKRIDNSINTLIRSKEENETYKSIFSDFISKSLGITNIPVSAQAFDKVLDKLNSQNDALQSIASSLSIKYTTNEQLCREVSEIYTSIVSSQSKSDKAYSQLTQVVNDLTQNLSDGEKQIRELEQKVKTYKESNDKYINENKMLTLQRDSAISQSEKQTKDYCTKESSYNNQIELLNKTITSQKNEIERRKAEIDELNLQISDFTIKNKNLEDIIENLRNDTQRMSAQIQDVLTKNNTQAALIKEQKFTIDSANKQLEAFVIVKTESNKAHQENISLQSKLSSYETQNKSLHQHNTKLKNILNQFTEKIKENKTQIAELKNENEKLRSSVADLETELSSQTSNYQSLVEELNSFTQEMTKMKEDNSSLKSNLSTATQKLKESELNNSSLKNQVDIAASQIATLNSEKETLITNLKARESSENSLREELGKTQSSLESMKSINAVQLSQLESLRSDMLKLHESDAEGQLAIEDLKKSKEIIKKQATEIDTCRDKISECESRILQLKSDLDKLTLSNSSIDNENKNLKKMIDDRDKLIESLRTKTAETSQLSSRLESTASQLEDTRSRLKHLTSQFNDINRVRSNEIQDSQTAIAKLTHLVDRKNAKISELKSLLKQAVFENSQLIHRNEVLAETSMRNQYDTISNNNTIDRSEYENLKNQLESAKQALAEAETALTDKDRQISQIMSQRKSLNRDNEMIDSVRNIVNRIRSICSSQDFSADTVISNLPPLFEIFGFSPNIRKSSLNRTRRSFVLQSRQVFSLFKDDVDIFTKNDHMLLSQVITKLLQLPSTKTLNRKVTSANSSVGEKLSSILMIIEGIKSQFDQMEANQRRLDSIVSSQHSAIVKMNEFIRSPASSPMK